MSIFLFSLTSRERESDYMTMWLITVDWIWQSSDKSLYLTNKWKMIQKNTYTHSLSHSHTSKYLSNEIGWSWLFTAIKWCFPFDITVGSRGDFYSPSSSTYIYMQMHIQNTSTWCFRSWNSFISIWLYSRFKWYYAMTIRNITGAPAQHINIQILTRDAFLFYWLFSWDAGHLMDV